MFRYISFLIQILILFFETVGLSSKTFFSLENNTNDKKTIDTNYVHVCENSNTIKESSNWNKFSILTTSIYTNKRLNLKRKKII